MGIPGTPDGPERRARPRRGLRLRRQADTPLLAMRIAAMLAALLLTAGLVTRFTVLLTSYSPDVRDRVAPDGALTLSLDRDDPLHQEVGWTPGASRTVCTVVRTGGDADPESIGLHLAGGVGDPALLAATRLLVESGSGPATPAAPGSCEGFRRTATVLDTSLADALARHGSAADATHTPDPGSGVTATWIRSTAWLPIGTTDVAQGSRVEDVDLVLTVLAEPRRAPWLETSLLVLGAFAQDSLLPLLVALAACVLFLGVQGRIDRREVKLIGAATARREATPRFLERDQVG